MTDFEVSKQETLIAKFNSVKWDDLELDNAVELFVDFLSSDSERRAKPKYLRRPLSTMKSDGLTWRTYSMGTRFSNRHFINHDATYADSPIWFEIPEGIPTKLIKDEYNKRHEAYKAFNS